MAIRYILYVLGHVKMNSGKTSMQNTLHDKRKKKKENHTETLKKNCWSNSHRDAAEEPMIHKFHKNYLRVFKNSQDPTDLIDRNAGIWWL